MDDVRVNPVCLAGLEAVTERMLAGGASEAELRLALPLLLDAVRDLSDMHDYLAGIEADYTPDQAERDCMTSELRAAIERSDNVQVLGGSLPDGAA